VTATPRVKHRSGTAATSTRRNQVVGVVGGA
jgi:hypothetical protein